MALGKKKQSTINRICKYNPVLANAKKRKRLVALFPKYISELQKYASQYLYAEKTGKFSGKDVTDKIDFPARLSQVLASQGNGVIGAIREKVANAEKAKLKKKYQHEVLEKYKSGTLAIEIKNTSICLDRRFVEMGLPKKAMVEEEVDEETGPRNFWIKITSFPTKSFRIPARKTKQMIEMEKRGFVLRTDTLTIYSDGKLGFHYQKPNVHTQKAVVQLGIDTGRNKLISCSNGVIENTHPNGMLTKDILDRINRRMVRSKSAERARLFLRNQICYSVKNDIAWDQVSEVFIEDLRSIKKGNSWGKKHQFWAVGFTHERLKQLCEENDVRLTRVPAAYTSQRCSVCGVVDKKSRHGEDFCCTSCGFTEDADINAACNILARGVYSPSVLKNKLSII